MIALTLSILVGAGACAETNAVSVCEALNRREALNGKTISIRGIQVATEEGAWLNDPACVEPVSADARPGHAVIWLGMSGDRRRAAGFGSTDLQASVKRINGAIAKQRFDPGKDRLWLTYVGVLWSDLGGVPQADGSPGGARQPGFGHINTAPAELVVKDVRDAFVERGAKPLPKKP
jgi:hypothetical protein